MPNVFYAIVYFILNLLVYFYCSRIVFLIVFILLIVLLLYYSYIPLSNVFIEKVNSFNRHLNSKKNYINLRKMSSRRLNITGKSDSSFKNEFIGNYDYRKPRTSFRDYSVLSPVRNNSTFSAIDENFISRTDLHSSNNCLSPIRPFINSPNRTSPLNYSRRFNSDSVNESNFSVQCPEFLIPESSPSRDTPKRKSLSGSSSWRGGRMVTTANEMGVDDFPLVCSTVPIIPFIQSPYSSSPQRDSSLRKNRVRVRLTSSQNSDSSLTASLLDMTTLEEPTTTVKAVTEVLKERVRKRTYISSEEDEEQKDIKRRPEHNLYLSRLNEVEENPSPQLPRTNGEDDRKRIREPDWESSNVVGTKRRRTNTYVVNNEILSSLSSSIGLRQTLHSPVAEKPKRNMSIGTQVNLTKDSPNKKHMEQSAQTKKEVKEAGTMPDPPQPPSRPRSPVKEKTVSNANVILKSALSKFKIQPKEDTKKTDDLADSISLSTPASSTTNVLPSNPPTPTSSSILTAINLPNPKTPLTFGGQNNSLGTTNSFSLPKSTAAPQFNFGSPTVTSPQTIPVKNNETSKDLEPDITKKDDSKTEYTGFKLNSSVVDPQKSESPFKFGAALPQQNTVFSQVTPSTQSESAGVKSSEAKQVTSSPLNFTFGPAKTESSLLSTFGVPKPQEPSTTSVSSPTSALQLPQTSSTSVVSFSATPSNQTFQFGGATENTNLPKEESKTSTFSFGKVENKTPSESEKPVSDAKPFQFGSNGNFSFGQVDNKSNKDKTISPFAASTSTATTVSSANPVFSFGGTTKKEEKSGGFSFKLPTAPSSPSTQSPNFNFNNATGSTPASSSVSASTASTTPKSTATLFPSTLFGSSPTTSVVGLSSAVTTSATNSSLVQGTATTSSSFGSLKPTFGTTSATPAFGSVSSSFSSGTSSLFGGNPTTSTTTSTTSIFGSNNNQGSPSIFGSGTNKPAITGIKTTTVSAFGSSSGATTTPAFGSTTTGGTLSNPTTATTSNSSIFGSNAAPSLFTPAFGTTTSAAASTFGTTTSAASTFGTTTSAAPTFGTTTKATPAFGSTTTATPSFGSTSTATPSFGSTTTATPSFGSTSTATPSFGSTTTATPTFGSVSTSTPAFRSSGSNPTTFGNTAITTPSSSQAFGSSTSTFGSTTPGLTAQTFGTTTTTNLFGGNTTGGATPSFGNNVTSSTSAFGVSTTPSSNVPAFGSGNTTSAFGSSTTPSFGSTTTAPAPFGSTQTQGFGNQQASAFGSTPAFAPQSSFGNQNTTPAFGSTPAFGGSSGTNTFGSSNSSTPAPTFGSTNTTTPTPAFGSTNTATPTPAFGSTNTATPTPAFGSTNTGTPTPAFGTTNTTTATSAFGSSTPSTFGASTFGSQEANKPFSFNAPATQPVAPTSGFNFAATQQPQSAPGLFQFGAAVPSTPQPNQPFQFNAAQPSTQVGSGGQQMFSIGSGSTAPRRMPPRRKK